MQINNKAMDFADFISSYLDSPQEHQAELNARYDALLDLVRAGTATEEDASQVEALQDASLAMADVFAQPQPSAQAQAFARLLDSLHLESVESATPQAMDAKLHELHSFVDSCEPGSALYEEAIELLGKLSLVAIRHKLKPADDAFAINMVRHQLHEWSTRKK